MITLATATLNCYLPRQLAIMVAVQMSEQAAVPLVTQTVHSTRDQTLALGAPHAQQYLSGSLALMCTPGTIT